LKKCHINLPNGLTVDLKSLAKDTPPDYSIMDNEGNKYYFNVCRNTIMTCNGYDDAIALQYNAGKFTLKLHKNITTYQKCLLF
jgi:hypothetical protein